MRRTPPPSRRFRAPQATGHFKAVTGAHRSRRSTWTIRAARAASPIVNNGEEFFQPAKVVLAAELHVRELAVAAALEVEGVSERLVEQPRPSRAALLQPPSGRAGDRALSVQRRRVVRPAGAGRRDRRLRPTTTSITQAVDFIGGCNLWAMSDRRPIGGGRHEHVRPRAELGVAVEGVHQGERRPLAQLLQPEDHAAVRGQLPRSRSGREGSARPPVIRITGEFKENERKIAAFSQDKMEQWYRAAGAIQVTKGPTGGAMGASTHAYGGTRMGDNPETNVVNRWGLSHEVPEPRRPRRIGDGHERRAQSRRTPCRRSRGAPPSTSCRTGRRWFPTDRSSSRRSAAVSCRPRRGLCTFRTGGTAQRG